MRCGAQSASAPVATAATPSAARAAAVSMLRIRACACGLRTNATWSMRGNSTSVT